MKGHAWSLAIAVSLFSSCAIAADAAVKMPAAAATVPAPLWDIEITAELMTDYYFRGITQSNHRPSAAAGFEPRFNITPDLQAYAGAAGASIDLPNRAAAEMRFYGGVRPTFGPLRLDGGFRYYYYPGGQCFNTAAFCESPGGGPSVADALPNGNVIKQDLNFWEVYGKAAYTVNDNFEFGGEIWYSPSVLNSGARGIYYAGNVTLTAPGTWFINGVGAYVSGDVGYWQLGTTDAFYGVVSPLGDFASGVPYKSYWNWDAGIAFTWKAFTLDLRYYDTNLSKADCNVFTSDHTAAFSPAGITPANPTGLTSNWCRAAFIAKLSFSTTINERSERK